MLPNTGSIRLQNQFFKRINDGYAICRVNWDRCLKIKRVRWKLTNFKLKRINLKGAYIFSLKLGYKQVRFNVINCSIQTVSSINLKWICTLSSKRSLKLLKGKRYRCIRTKNILRLHKVADSQKYISILQNCWCRNTDLLLCINTR